ncbi:MAG: hypothetical protein C0597_08485 [Marinilabiliales bacterium]|nr:MAG: hypothetical protein C0597_08485 [Marinilabiliales bacterium]
MPRNTLLLLVFFFITRISYSQLHDHQEEHHHPEWELGFSSGLVHNITEKETSPGIHVHIIKTVSKTDKLGLGFGYEAIFDDHKHNAVSLIILYRPIEHVSFNFAPGISWLSTEKDSAKPSLHLEALYEWEFGNFHIGPLLGVASNLEDLHGSVGLHLAFGF